VIAELFKKAPEAFKHLATSDDILELTRLYHEYFSDIPDDDGVLIQPAAIPFDTQNSSADELGII
jgi:hypothetical protein